jgi:hypothetical protein
VGDIFVIPGNTIQDANGNFLLTPDNDVTVTVTVAPDGYIGTAVLTGTLPRPQEVWPSDSINDGGDDEYDTGNYITTNLESNIIYNSGAPIINSTAFGGGDYVVTYQNSIFGVFAVNPVIDSIATQGSSGFDGYGQADTGSLYGAADSGVNIGNFVFTNSTLTATEDDLYIKAVDDLWLDALQDDIHIRANDDVRIKVGYDFDADSAQQEWRFDTSGYINFPDGSQQTTAYTGNSFSGNYSDLTNRPNGNTAVHDLIGGASSDDNGKFLQQDSTGTSIWAAIPTIPADVSDLTDTTGLLFSGSYSDLSNAPILFSGEYNALTGKPTLFSGDYNDLTNKPTSRIAVATGTGPGGNNQADSLALAGLNPVTDIPSTWGGDLILQGGVGGANGDLYGEVRIKSGQIGANYEWHFTTDKKIKLPAGGDIVDSNGTSVLGGGSSFSGSYTDLTNKPTIPTDVNQLTDTTGLLPAAWARYEAKNANFTAEVFKTYWLNSGTTAKTVTLPASPTAGDWVKIYDGSLNWSTYNLTVNGNGNQIRVVNMMSPPVSWGTPANSVTLSQSAISPNGPLGVIFNWDGTHWYTAA